MIFLAYESLKYVSCKSTKKSFLSLVTMFLIKISILSQRQCPISTLLNFHFKSKFCSQIYKLAVGEIKDKKKSRKYVQSSHSKNDNKSI